jgi:hypothetical protein
MSEQKALGLFDAGAIPRESLIMAFGYSLGFALRVKSLSRNLTIPERDAFDAAIADFFDLYRRLAGVSEADWPWPTQGL